MIHPLRESVAAAIRSEMQRQGVTQDVLAERLGWTQARVSRRVSAVVPVRTDELGAIARALGVSVESLTAAGA